MFLIGPLWLYRNGVWNKNLWVRHFNILLWEISVTLKEDTRHCHPCTMRTTVSWSGRPSPLWAHVCKIMALFSQCGKPGNCSCLSPNFVMRGQTHICMHIPSPPMSIQKYVNLTEVFYTEKNDKVCGCLIWESLYLMTTVPFPNNSCLLQFFATCT